MMAGFHAVPSNGTPQGGEGLDGVVALVLTFRRRRLATEVVRGLIEREGFPAESVIVIVNGEGGLEDDDLAGRVRMVYLEQNLGPAGGFRIGLQLAADLGAGWVYLCEDDVGLFDLPSPRVARTLKRLHNHPGQSSIGAVVAYGRVLDRGTGRTVPYIPASDVRDSFPEVDVAAWGASLVRCAVVAKGILPDQEMFFGFEDFDFWLAMRAQGLRLVVDGDIAADVAERVFTRREDLLRASRPIDAEEPWRMYYEARNFVAFAKRHGKRMWIMLHVALTVRRIQLSPTRAHKWAAVHGLFDGLRGNGGMNPRYLRGRPERAGHEFLASGEQGVGTE